MSDFYNYDEEKKTYSPYDTPEPEKKPKKKGSFGTKLGKALCLGLVFGWQPAALSGGLPGRPE